MTARNAWTLTPRSHRTFLQPDAIVGRAAKGAATQYPMMVRVLEEVTHTKSRRPDFLRVNNERRGQELLPFTRVVSLVHVFVGHGCLA